MSVVDYRVAYHARASSFRSRCHHAGVQIDLWLDEQVQPESRVAFLSAFLWDGVLAFIRGVLGYPPSGLVSDSSDSGSESGEE